MKSTRCLHSSVCNVEPCEELRASPGWTGFATAFPEPLLDAAYVPAWEGWKVASVLHASHLICSSSVPPCLLLVPVLRSQPCQTSGGFVFHQRASLYLCYCFGTKFFLLLPLSAGDEDQFLPSAVTAAFHSMLWARAAWGGGDVAHLGDRVSLKGSSWITCHLFLLPGMRMTCSAGAPLSPRFWQHPW